MDADLQALVRDGRVLEAASLASERGHTRDACALFERACEWTRAAVEALRSGDVARAVEFAVRGGDEALATQASTVTLTRVDAERVAARLAESGLHGWAARVLEPVGATVEAARAWQRAGAAVRAATLFESAGDPKRAAEVLEQALRRDSDDAAASVALGRLLARFGKDEAAFRVLQRVSTDRVERHEALGLLTTLANRLGWRVAASEAKRERDALATAATATSELEPEVGPAPPRVLGRYVVASEVASSPTTRTLDAFDTIDNERVALDVYVTSGGTIRKRAAFRRFEHDAAAAATLRHPHIVAVRHFFADVCAAARPWPASGTLDDLMQRGPVAPHRAAEIACSLLEALGEAHRIGVLHGDLQPAHVLFDAAGNVCLSGFGVVYLRDAQATPSEGAHGSAYRSPEERAGHPITVRSDVFAVGMLFRAMLTGADEARTVEAADPNDDATNPSLQELGLDARHEALVKRWTSPTPAERPADAFEARRDLLALIWPTRIPASPAPPLGPKLERAHRWRIDACGRGVDLWTGRAIERVALSPTTLQRARAFAAADHPSLQTVLAVDRENGAIWLEALDDATREPLSADESKDRP